MDASRAMPALPAWPATLMDTDPPRVDARRGLEAALRSRIAFCAKSFAFRISVGVLSLVAIWMSRGWIGLFFSGQLLYGGAHLLKAFTSGMQHAPCRSAGTLRTRR